MKRCERHSRHHPIFKSITGVHKRDEYRHQQIDKNETPAFSNLNGACDAGCPG